MIYWLILMALAIIVEILTTDLVSIWIVLGSLAGLVLNMLHLPVWIQITVAVVVTIVVALLVRPFAKDYLRGNIVKTNIDRNVGKKVILTKTLTANDKGEVKLNGETWSVISLENETIDKGQEVTIIGIDGNKLIVRK